MADCRTKMKNKALNIVIIDDNQHLLASLENLLTILGHTVFAASTAEAGMQLVQERRPGMLFCDIALQGKINGYGVARMLRMNAAVAGAFFVALSGNSTQEDREKSVQAGFDRHVAKPASLADISGVLDAAWIHQLRQAPGS